ncbi:MAG: hypothetical protein JJ975_10810, partial [Bacteroidia bacterium]|nr:hypothetical protein [Bacteroidia bacterium]
MATGKLSPRQKMINMMYLVLMALLALNVSKEILKTFHLMEVSFNRAKENLDDKIDVQMAAFRNQVENTQTLVPYYERALESDRITNEFVDYIEGIKTDLINKTGGRQELEEGNEGGELYEAELVATDNMEVHANYFMVDNRNGEQKAGWRGTELENRINTAREELLALLETDLDAGVKIERNDADAVRRACQLSAVLTEREASSHKSWSAKYLENSPLAGVITMLTKIQSDAKATQGAVLDVLYKGEVPNIPISQIVPIVRPLNGSVIMNGGTYEAEIVLAAQTKGNENDLYELKSGSGSLEKRGNSWFYKANSTNAGNHSFNGLVTVKTPTGDKIHD